MHIISSTILFMLVLNASCTGQKNEDWTISFTPAEVTAVSGLCALISCAFTYPDKAKPINNLLWYQCDETGQCKNTLFNYENVKNKKEERGKTDFETKRIKFLEPDLDAKNCSFILKNITAEDEGQYAFRVEGSWPNRNTYTTKVKITIQDKPVIKIPLLKEHKQANLSCSAPFPCPETPPDITWWIKNRGGQVIEVKENITLTTSKSFYLSTLTLIPTSKLHNATVGCEVSYGDIDISDRTTIEVMYVETPRILGNDKVNEGDTLSLNCTVDSHPASSKPEWSFNGTTDQLRSYISAESLTITNVSKQHAGEYICVVTYMNEILNTSININVIRPKGSDSAEVENLTGKDEESLNINRNSTAIKAFLKNLELSTILTFLAGMAASALIFSVVLCCWVSCNRAKKHKVLAGPPDTAVNLETVQTNMDPTVTNEQTPLHGQMDAGMSNTQVESTGGAEESNAGGAESGEVDYAAIDYSLLKKKPPEEVERESVDTEYAEIRRDGRRREAPSE